MRERDAGVALLQATFVVLCVMLSKHFSKSLPRALAMPEYKITAGISLKGETKHVPNRVCEVSE